MASIFISYSHKDEFLKEQLDVHLSTLKHQGQIDAWHDRKIKAGDEFDSAISAELNRADVILLLVSPDFLASRYIRDVELKRAMERNKARDARVIPVILQFCDWEGTQFGKLLAAPKDGKPIKSWQDPDEAFLDVVRMIRTALPPAQRTVRRKLAFKIKSPGDEHSIYPLPNVDKLRIGRAADNDLVLARRSYSFPVSLYCDGAAGFASYRRSGVDQHANYKWRRNKKRRTEASPST